MKAKSNSFEATTETAYSIGRKLCKEAIWVGNCCTWQGYDKVSDENGSEVLMRSFGPDLHSGLAGIALFLAELSERVEDTVVLNTLEGAVKTLIKQIGDSEMESVFSVYSGQVGIGFALCRIGELTAHPEWRRAGLRLLESVVETAMPEDRLDVFSGIAGAIPVFLRLHQEEENQSFLGLALHCGDTLIDQAMQEENYWSWKTLPDYPALTGYAHGASGIAMAFLSLFEFTGDQMYLTAAMKAFAFEEAHFDSWQNNWLDLRYKDALAKQNKCGESWAHGAPGMALVRLQAYRITGNKDFLKEARLALDTTCELVSAQLKNPSATNYSLCSGLAGNADILMTGNCELNEPAYAQVAQQVAKLGRMLYDHTDSDWPGSIADASGNNQKYPTPGLMTGLAGTGHFYLRLSQKPPDNWLLIT